MSSKTKLVRIKPYNKRRGQLVRRFVYAGQPFAANLGWYRVSASLADKLAKCCQDPNDPESGPVFDVMSEEEARALDDQETAASTEKAPVDRAHEVKAEEPAPKKAEKEEEVKVEAVGEIKPRRGRKRKGS